MLGAKHASQARRGLVENVLDLGAGAAFFFQSVRSREPRNAAAYNRDPAHEVWIPSFAFRPTEGTEREAETAEYS